MQSLKKNIIAHLISTTTIDELKNNKIIVSTPAGTYFGDYYPTPDAEDDALVSIADAVVGSLADITDNYLAETDIDSIDGNDGYFCLKNVELKHGAASIKLPFVVLFFDQVVGISLGHN